MPGVRLGVEEREVIALGVARRESFAEIARRMRRPTSTVAREVGRNGGRDGYVGAGAQKALRRRGRRPKVPKLVANVALAAVAAVVADGLSKRWSPPRWRPDWLLTIPMKRRCGCRTRRSTHRCTCRARAA